ncbi:MAG: hypothetical protein M3R61_19530, partial [Chloroflexota bacterium]|nr:hypothetical protein [Chloroflexota bacterium]
MNQSLTEILRNLPAAGPSGFEGLIADLLSHFTGRQFHLAQSGTQQGRDMSSRHPYANVTAVECKRYGSNTELNQRELLGEIVQATIAIPDLDLWVLVASRDVSSQLRESLQRATYDRGVELLIISDGDASPSSLAVLCADSPAIVVACIQQHLPDEVTHVQALLVQTAATPEYADRRAYLRDALITPLLGYDNWRAEQNRWLTQSFQSAAASHARFGQILNISQEGIRLIERREAWQRLDSWLNAWTDDRRPITLLGQEGDGKTWAVASWVGHKVVYDPQCPPVVFLSSAELQTNEPLELLVQAVAHRSTGMHE